MTDKIVHVRITGKVQGVYYRAWTKENADELEVTGWVRNVSDGSVEAIFSGEENAVTALLAKCLEGPSAAKVDNIEHLNTPQETIWEFFEILPSA